MRGLSHLIIILLSGLLVIPACQPVVESPITLPTLAQLPTSTITPTATPTLAATLTPTMTPTVTASATITDTPIVSPTATVSRTPTPTAAFVWSVPTATATALPQTFIFGRSVNGRELIAYRYGTGRHVVMLIGGIHAGYEANTVTLLEALRDHFDATPQDVLPDITLLLIPTMNPDALAYGRQLRGRFNANNVDLNRNWRCNWSTEAWFNDRAVNPGERPFSEPETTAVGSLIQQVQPSVVLFYHAAANGLYPGACDGQSVSLEMVRIYGEASGYPYGTEFGSYTLTGTASAWVDSLGIPAAAVELATAEGTEFARNLRGIMAIQTWLTQQS